MNEDNENERQDQKENDSLLRSLIEDTKRKSKSKFNMVFRKAMAVVMPVLLKLLIPAMLVFIVIAGGWSIIKDYSENNASAEASSQAIQSKEIVDITPSNDGDGYYFKISKDVVKTYIKELNNAYNNGYYNMYVDKDNQEEQDNESDDEKFDESDMKKWFGTEDYEAYFVKMIRAEIASTYPRLSNSNVVVAKNDAQNNPIDKDGNYVAQGVVQIKRTKMNLDGNVGEEIFLDYLPHENFSALVEANDISALNYFSFDPEKGLIYYATYQETAEKIDDGDAVITFSLSERSESYKALTSMCSMPYNFTFSLLQKTGNPEWVMAVIDLLLEEENNEVILMIQDQLSINTDTEVKAQVEETYSVTYQLIYPETTESNEQNSETSQGDSKSIVNNEETTENNEQSSKTNQGDGKSTVNEEETTETEESTTENVAETESEPIEESRTYAYKNTVTTVTKTKTYTNTAYVFIQKANTWCMDFEQEAVLNSVVPIIGEEVKYKYNEINENNDDDQENEEYYENNSVNFSDLNFRQVGLPTPSGDNPITITTINVSNEYIPYSTKTDYVSYTFSKSITKEKTINYDRFLGTLKNATGRYYVGSQYKSDGKEIKYKEPGGNRAILNPSTQICDGDGQTINRLLNYLALHEDTQMHEQLMMYFWNIYTNSNIYDVNVEGLIGLFNTNTLSTVHGTTLVNYIKAWENHSLWQYETKMSSQFPEGYLSEDGTSYIVYEDGSAGHNNVSYGIATFITNSNNIKANHPEYGEGYYNGQDVFMQYGVDVTTLKTGDLVPVDAAMVVFDEILSGFESKVDTYLSSHGLELERTQRDALVAVCYQFGNIDGFAEAYEKSLDEEGNIDAELIKENFALTYNGGSTPFKYSSTMNDRKYANWYLFTEGNYIDRSGNIIKAFGGTILECAKQIHDYMSDSAHLYYYCLNGRETVKNEHINAGLNNCGLNTSFEASQIPGNNGYRLTCCATYVSWVLDAAGYLETPTHSTTTLNSYLRNLGWIVISSYSELEPGDIVFMDTVGVNNGVIEHVQIYVGNGTWYNAGGNRSIQRVEPSSTGAESSQFIFALRAPN